MALHTVADARCFARSVFARCFVELHSFAAKFCPTVENDRRKFRRILDSYQPLEGDSVIVAV